MPLMKVSEFQRKRFTPDSRPDRRTVRRWVENGHLYGEMLGGVLYVDPDRDRQPAAPKLTSPIARRIVNS